ncbi:MAG: hypothetical protein PHN49_04880 [Candidatus Omnitrophica bacterium]|nr:hypothetical protein [Candidatus Omnitrophota bacterium]MDD5670955.1 hypothetical protein [Candidatus Omnitrophota bacterium]
MRKGVEGFAMEERAGLFVLTILFVLSCYSGAVLAETTGPAGVTVQIKEVSEKPAEGFTPLVLKNRTTHTEDTLYVSNTDVIAISDIKKLKVRSIQSQDDAVWAVLDEAQRKALAVYTANHLGKYRDGELSGPRLGIVINGELRDAPTILVVIDSPALLLGPNFTGDEIKRIKAETAETKER